MKIDLPFPPSANTYWRYYNGRVLLSKKGREYKKDVAIAVQVERLRGAVPATPFEGRLSVSVSLFPPDRRKRDIDNYGGKALLDALQYAGVYHNDSQVDELFIKRMEVKKGGSAVVEVQCLS